MLATTVFVAVFITVTVLENSGVRHIGQGRRSAQ
jgi:hypothetical protein